ncbi:MAG: alpha/beta fold hydrolase [Alphaproteobacteria bacterium]|nr:alpha/beta fold hydrolase [Alphaproteobacteria bacterium]
MQSAAQRTEAEPFVDRFARTADGLKLHAREYAPLPPETGLPVICLHGLTRNARDFEIVAPRIAALGRRTIAIDVRGRGGSDRDADPAHYTAAVYAQDIIAAMTQFDVPRAVFVGASMGGLITMLIASFAPDRVAAAVLNDIGPELNPAGLKRIAGFVGQQPAVSTWKAAADAARANNEHAFPHRDAAFWDAFARRTYVARADGLVEPDYDPMIALAFQGQDEDAPPPDMTQFFDALAKAPILLVRGGTSDLISADHVARMRARAKDFTSVELEGIGHAPMLDEPEAWHAMIDFLARVP